MKKTNREIYDLIESNRDTIGFPYFGEAQVSELFNSEYVRYVDEVSNLPEGEPLRARIAPLVQEKQLSDTGVIPASALSGSMKILSILADFDFECRGDVNRYTRPVTPLSFDALGVSLDDPSTQPSDTFPSYIEKPSPAGRSIEIKSDNTPKKIYLWYIKYPDPIDIENDPNGTIELDALAQEEIIKRVLSQLAGIVADPRYQIFKNEERN